MAYIENSPFRTAISGLEVINEPRPYTTSQIQELEDYYTRSYETIQSSTFPVAMFIADGYVNGSIEFWRPFAESHATTPPSVIMAEHPYPGNL
jgi:glucan 1,3-beta-glucosidase